MIAALLILALTACSFPGRGGKCKETIVKHEVQGDGGQPNGACRGRR